MRVTCEKVDRKSELACKSVITIMSSHGEVVDRISVPHDDGVLYCTENPRSEEGVRFHKAISKAKERDRKPFIEGGCVWRCVKYLKPSKTGFFWVSDGLEVWAATITTHAQVNTITNQERAQFFLPISESAPGIPKP